MVDRGAAFGNLEGESGLCGCIGGVRDGAEGDVAALDHEAWD